MAPKMAISKHRCVFRTDIAEPDQLILTARQRQERAGRDEGLDPRPAVGDANPDTSCPIANAMLRRMVGPLNSSIRFFAYPLSVA